MTTDQALFAAIEANPEDSTVKLVYADFLDENGDPRGPGYRAMGHSGKWPIWTSTRAWYWWACESKTVIANPWQYLPADWFALLKVKGKNCKYAPYHGYCDPGDATLRELMDAAALAFARLTPSQQRKYLPKEVMV